MRRVRDLAAAVPAMNEQTDECSLAPALRATRRFVPAELAGFKWRGGVVLESLALGWMSVPALFWPATEGVQVAALCPAGTRVSPNPSRSPRRSPRCSECRQVRWLTQRAFISLN